MITVILAWAFMYFALLGSLALKMSFPSSTGILIAFTVILLLCARYVSNRIMQKVFISIGLCTLIIVLATKFIFPVYNRPGLMTVSVFFGILVFLISRRLVIQLLKINTSRKRERLLALVL